MSKAGESRIDSNLLVARKDAHLNPILPCCLMLKILQWHS